MQRSTVAIRFLSTDSFAYRCNRDDGIDEYIGGRTYYLYCDCSFAAVCALMCNDMGWDYEDTNVVYLSGQAVADHHTPENMSLHDDVITLCWYSQKALGVPTVAIRFLYTEVRACIGGLKYDMKEYTGDYYISGLKYDLKLDNPLTKSCVWMCYLNNMGWEYDDWRFVYMNGVSMTNEDTPRSLDMTAYGTVTLYCERKASVA